MNHENHNSHDRLPPIPQTEWSDDQRHFAREIIDGPRGALISPFVPLLRSPELMRHAQRMGEYLRYRSAIDRRLFELTILIIARQWSQQVEWVIHAPIAMQAGITLETINAIANDIRPEHLSEDEALIYDFCIELHRTHEISDATWAKAVKCFSEHGVIDLIGINGYYTFLAMIMNAAQTQIPGSPCNHQFLLPKIPQVAASSLSLSTLSSESTSAELCLQHSHLQHSQSPLHLRAKLLAKIRQFFDERKVIEVETPLLGPSTIPSPHLESFTTSYSYDSSIVSPTPTTLYLQTSPEFAMKRLLTQYRCDIYQICKAFRNHEYGKLHNPEFTILEWYRINYNHHQLMTEVDEFLRFILNINDKIETQRFTYAEIFDHYLKIDPHLASIEELQQCAKKHDININNHDDHHNHNRNCNCNEINEDNDERDMWLQLLLTHLIEPKLTQLSQPEQQTLPSSCQLQLAPVFIYDFPVSQAALAKIQYSEKPATKVAARFEVYIKGIELANGFHELEDADEQRQRFKNDLNKRRKLGLHCPPIDEKFLQALSAMPQCSGVALGVDRLLMIASNASNLSNIISFDIEAI